MGGGVSEERSGRRGRLPHDALKTPVRAIFSGGDDGGDELDDLITEMPRVIGRFVVQRRVGRGGMGEVYAAFDPHLDREIAVKVLHERPSARAARAARMRREAQAMARVSHPHVVQIFEVGEHQGRTYIAMEYVEGVTLEAWRRRAARSPDEVLEAYRQAGRGLAAAHRAGVLHRDFKPSNVIIDVHGRVRVMDFGLAAWLPHSESVSTQGSRLDLEITTQESCPSLRLTRDGVKVGTPAFMAPEQYCGTPLDERADQFAFCVSLYETLFGAHPFGDGNAHQLRQAIVAGELAAPSVLEAQPRWLARALRRGLAADRERRWPDMEALLHALSPRPRADRARRLGLVLGGLGLSVGLVVVTSGALERSTLCTGAGERLDEVWNEQRRREAKEGLIDSDVPLAASVWSRSERDLEAYAQRWARVHGQVCEATHVRGAQSPELMDQRMRCLSRRLDAMASLLATFEDADPELVIRVDGAVSRLPAPERCQTMGPVRAHDLELDHPRAMGLRRRLVAAQAELEVGRFGAAQRQFDRVRGEALIHQLPRLAAEALVRRGQAQRALGWVRPAEQDLDRGFWESMRVGADSVAFEASVEHMELVGTVLVQPERALAGLTRSESVLARLEDADAARVEFATRAGVVLARLGRYAEARQRIDEALSLARAVHGEHHVAYADALRASGWVFVSAGRLDEAEEVFGRVLALEARLYDPQHIRLASPLNNIAIVRARRGDMDGAYRRFEQAYTLRRAALGDAHVLVGDSLMNLAGVALAQGRVTSALADLDRARTIYAAALGEGSAKTNDADLARALATVATGRDAEAEVILRDVLERQREALGERHPDLVLTLDPLTALLVRTGRPRQAQPLVRLAVELERAKVLDAGREPGQSRTLETLKERLEAVRASGGDLPQGLGAGEGVP